MGVAAPVQMLRAMQDFLHAHLEDHVRVCADPRAACSDIAQQDIERHTGLTSTERINPHKHPIDRQKLLAHLVRELFIIDCGFGIDAQHRQFLEDAMITIILRCRDASRFAITPPDNCYSVWRHALLRKDLWPRQPMRFSGYRPRISRLAPEIRSNASTTRRNIASSSLPNSLRPAQVPSARTGRPIKNRPAVSTPIMPVPPSHSPVIRNTATPEG